MYLKTHFKQNDLVIRNAIASDAIQLAKWWNDGAIMSHAGFPNGLGISADTIARSIAQDDDEIYRRLIIEFNLISIGEMSYRNLGSGIAEIGIKICDFSRQEKGLGKVFLSMLIKELFNDLKYKKIVLDTNLNNLRAQHVYEQLGFSKVRINTDSWKNQLGELQSSIDYELVIHDFIDYTNK